MRINGNLLLTYTTWKIRCSTLLVKMMLHVNCYIWSVNGCIQSHNWTCACTDQGGAKSPRASLQQSTLLYFTNSFTCPSMYRKEVRICLFSTVPSCGNSVNFHFYDMSFHSMGEGSTGTQLFYVSANLS